VITSPFRLCMRQPRITNHSAWTSQYQVENSVTKAVTPVPPYVYPLSSYAESEEYMDDYSGKRRIGAINPCTHYRKTRSTLPANIAAGTSDQYVNGVNSSNGLWVLKFPISSQAAWDQTIRYSIADAGPYALFGAWADPIGGLPYVGGSPEVGQYTPLGLADMLDNALFHIIPGIKPKGGISLLNSLYELKDFKSLPRTIRRLRAALPLGLPRGRAGLDANFTDLISLARREPRKTLRGLLRAGSDAYLQAKFNILPLLSDISNIHGAVSDVKYQLNKLLRDASKTVRRHYTVDITDLSNSTSNYSGNRATQFVYRPVSATRQVVYLSKKLTVTMEYSYTLPSWVNKDSLVPALLDRFGVNLNAGIIWNAIPWSFVVDWVLGVSRWLGNRSIKNIQPILHIHQACWSVHVVRSISTALTCYNTTMPGVYIVEDYYRRVPYLPTPASLKASGLNSSEFILGAALVFSR